MELIIVFFGLNYPLRTYEALVSYSIQALSTDEVHTSLSIMMILKNLYIQLLLEYIGEFKKKRS